MDVEQKKKNRLFNVFIDIFLICAFVGAFLYSRGIAKPTVTVNGTELTINMTVQELVDAGFKIDSSVSGSGDMNLDLQPDIPGESYSSKAYYLYAPNQYGHYEYANISFRVFNKSVNSAEFKDSKIYSYTYDTGYRFSDSSVLINDINFANIGKMDAIETIEELGAKFDKDEKEELMSGERHYISGKSGNYFYIIETDYHDESVTHIEVKRGL